MSRAVTVGGNFAAEVGGTIATKLGKLVEGHVRTSMSASADLHATDEISMTATKSVRFTVHPEHSISINIMWRRKVRRGAVTVLNPATRRSHRIPFETILSLTAAEVSIDDVSINDSGSEKPPNVSS